VRLQRRVSPLPFPLIFATFCCLPQFYLLAEDLGDSLLSQTTFRSAQEADGLFPWMTVADFISPIWQFPGISALPRPQSPRFLFLGPWLLVDVCRRAALACGRWLGWL